MITNNIDIEDGLVNGAVGILEYILVKETTKQPSKIWLSFESPAVCKKTRTPHKNALKDSEIKEGLVPLSKTSSYTPHFK